MKISSNIGYYLLTQLPQLASGLLVSITATRILGPEAKGVFGLLTNDLMFFGLFLNLGIQVAAPYFIASKRLAPSAIFSVGFKHLALNLLLLGVLLFAGGAWFEENAFIPKASTSVVAVLYLMTGYALNYFNSLMNALFVGVKRIRYVNQGLLLAAVLNTLLFGTLFLWHRFFAPLGLNEVIFASLAVLLLISLYWFIRYTREFGRIRFKRVEVLPSIRMMFGFSLMAYISNVVGFLNYRVDLYFISYFTDFEQLGFYILAVNLVQMSWMISDPIATVLKPYLSDPAYEDRRSEIILSYTRLNASIVLVFSIMAYVLAAWVIPLLYGSEFAPSIIPFQILLLGNFFACNSKLHSVIHFATNKMKFNLLATLIGLALTLVFDFLLIPSGGIIGAAWASNISYFSIFAVLVFIGMHRRQLTSVNLFILTKEDLSIIRHG